MKRNKKFILMHIICLFSIICFAACGNSKAQPTYWDQKVLQFSEENTYFEKGQIVFVGDSITDAYNLEEFYSAYNLSFNLYNRGIGGDTTAGMLKRLKTSLFDLEPSKIVILIGINDLNAGKSSEYVIDNYKKILTNIKNNLPNCKVYVQSVYPVNSDTYNIAGSTSKIIEVNSKLRLLAAEKGYIYIDIFPQLKTNENLLDSNYAYDGLHPNAAGYSIVTSLIVNYLN